MKRGWKASQGAGWVTAGLLAAVVTAAVGSRPMAAPRISAAGRQTTGPGRIVVCLQAGTASAPAAPWIVTIDPRTGGRAALLARADAPRWAPDGSTLAFRQSGALWARTARGVLHRVGDVDAVPVWSPDGQQIIGSQTRMSPQGRFEFTTWRFDADGTHRTRLPIPQTDAVNDWSADGHWLLTTSDRHPPYGRGYQVYLLSPDGARQRRLTPPGGLSGGARFAPGDRRIVYSHQERGVDSLWVVDVDGGNRRCLFSDPHVLSRDPCWSPDGKQLAVVLEDWIIDAAGKKHGTTHPRLVLMDAAGKHRRALRLPPLTWLGAPDWR